MIVLLVAGCTCPSFGDMVVTDPDGLVDDTFEAEIAASIAEFATWTGREGVCVPELQIVEDVDTEVEARFGGLYQGSHQPILIRADVADADRVTGHELCHALDTLEGHSAANPDVFPAEDVAQSDGYPTDEARSAESFADACDDGPDGSISAQLEIHCGTEVADARSRYLQESVFTAWNSSIDTIPMQVSERTLTMADPVVAVGASDDMFLVLTTDLHTVSVTEMAPDTGVVGRTIGVADWTEDVAAVHVEDGLVLLTHAGEGFVNTELLVFDLETSTVGTGGIAADVLPVVTTHSGGVAYVAGLAFDTGTLTGTVLRAWELTTGLEVPIAAPPTWGTLVPTDGGVLTLDARGTLARYDRAAGTWSERVIPSGRVGWSYGANGLLYLLSGGDVFTPAVYDLDTDTWRLADPPCQDVDAAWSSSLTLGQRRFLLQNLDRTNTVRYVELAG